ncbi:hypothetical protein [Citrobacter youngae]|uniref:hypothetical protein n=1 Tax=Citrobacter youngae TaxID=133448 RepID=UPI002B23A8DC|nr:hypothetical protein [Citrobacter youngae]MEB1029638.1 hypothetical protein [Citrobacter youngae]
MTTTTHEELEKKCALQQSKLAALNELMEGVEKACDIAKAGIENLQLQNEELTVQLANAESKCRDLAADNEKAMESLKQADSAVKLAHEKFSALADENMALKSGHYNGMVLPETPATDAFLAEVRAQGVEGFLKFCGEENSVFVEAKAYYRSLSDAVDEFAAQLRQGVQS